MKWSPMLFFLVAGCLAAADDLSGHYVLEGVREVGSEMLLRPDGTFEYYLAYGAADYAAKGTWKRDGDSVVLNTTGADTPPFRLLSSSAKKAEGVRVWVKIGDRGFANLDVTLKTSDGASHARTDSDGMAEFAKAASPSAAFIGLRVYNLNAGPFELNPAHNDFVFQGDGDAIMRVPFKNERLLRDGSTLEMRYWDKDKAMHYRKAAQ